MTNALVRDVDSDVGRPALRRPTSLVDALQRARTIDRLGLTFIGPDLSTRDLTWKQVALEAERRCTRLLQTGLTTGDRIAMFAHEEESFVLNFFGAILGGLVPVPMSPPTPFGRRDLQLERVASILNRSHATCIVGPADLISSLDALAKLCPKLRSRITYEELSRYSTDDDSSTYVVEPQLQDLCLLQFTSGSTSQPKGVEVTHGNVMANAEALHDLLGTDVEQRVAVTWAPLFHDMGLIGSLIPSALYHSRHVFIPTATFVRQPQIWLQTVDRYRATITTANNYALRAAVKRLARDAAFDLSRLDVIVVGGEPIHPQIAEDFIEALRPLGLKETALTPAYGMAEATLAISTHRADARLRTLSIARDEYECQRQVRLAVAGEPSLVVVDCGIQLPDHDVAVADSEMNLLPEDRVGEILFRGPSVCRGYYDDPEGTKKIFFDGWLKTGDLGFIHDGHVFISGRLKDLIIVAGRNYYPQDIEWAVSHLPGVRSHHVIAFSVPGPEVERLVIVCESLVVPDSDRLDRLIRDLIVREFGVNPHDIVVADAGSLPQTSSGKPCRAQARNEYLARTAIAT